MVNFQKEKQFYCAKVSYELLDYNTSLTYLFVYFCRICNTVIIFVQNGFSVGSYSIYSALISHESNRYSYKKKENILTYLTFFCQQTRILPLAKRGIAWKRTLKPIRGIYRKSLLTVFVLKKLGKKWPILKMKQLLKNPGGTFLQIQTDIHVYADPLCEIIIKICFMYYSSS